MIDRKDLEQADLSDVTTGERIPAVMPGDVLRLDFMEPLGLSARALARDIDVPPNRITEILNGARAVTADTALRLGEHFGTSAEMWMNLQVGYDLELARESRRRAA